MKSKDTRFIGPLHCFPVATDSIVGLSLKVDRGLHKLIRYAWDVSTVSTLSTTREAEMFSCRLLSID